MLFLSYEAIRFASVIYCKSSRLGCLINFRVKCWFFALAFVTTNEFADSGRSLLYIDYWRVFGSYCLGKGFIISDFTSIMLSYCLTAAVIGRFLKIGRGLVIIDLLATGISVDASVFKVLTGFSTKLLDSFQQVSLWQKSSRVRYPVLCACKSLKIWNISSLPTLKLQFWKH